MPRRQPSASTEVGTVRPHCPKTVRWATGHRSLDGDSSRQRPPEEQARYRAVVRSALLKQELRKAGLPDVVATWCHEAGGSRQLTGASIKQRYPGHARQARHLAAMCRSVAYAGKYVVVDEDDIDVSNLEELMWAVCSRSDPVTSIDFIRNAWSTLLDPSILSERKAQGDFTNSRAIIDACRPFRWKDQYPTVNMPLPETAHRARDMFSWMLKEGGRVRGRRCNRRFPCYTLYVVARDAAALTKRLDVGIG